MCVASVSGGVADAERNAGLRAQLVEHLRLCGAVKVSLALHDEDVFRAAALRISHSTPIIDLLVSAWVESSNKASSLLEPLATHCDSFAAYLVTESSPLPDLSARENGARTPGMMQIVTLQVPDGMDFDEWYRLWRDEHTEIAIDTQSSFIYRQNLVVRSFSENSAPVAAIVEEAFPSDAMTSQRAFYNAVNDEAKFRERRKKMLESTSRFVDLAHINVMPASEYVWRFDAP